LERGDVEGGDLLGTATDIIGGRVASNSPQIVCPSTTFNTPKREGKGLRKRKAGGKEGLRRTPGGGALLWGFYGMRRGMGRDKKEKGE